MKHGTSALIVGLGVIIASIVCTNQPARSDDPGSPEGGSGSGSNNPTTSTPTPTPTPTSTATVTPPPAPEVCEQYWYLHREYHGAFPPNDTSLRFYVDANGNLTRTIAPDLLFTRNNSLPTNIANLFESIAQDYKDRVLHWISVFESQNATNYNATDVTGSTFYTRILGRFFNLGAQPDGSNVFFRPWQIPADGRAYNGFAAKFREWDVWGIIGTPGRGGRSRYYFCFDPSGSPVACINPGDNPDCGFESTSYNSPVSLAWKRDVDINHGTTAVNFPIVPSQRGRTFLWKASGDAPLVVYDPDTSGEVRSGAQLFGNWTFGGKQAASLDVGGRGMVQASPWRDGFEALGSLDRDFDGELSGEELRDLALWFDRNRNGVSEAGEVERLSKAGVTKLFYRGEFERDANGDIHLPMGYERKVNGSIVQGRSVDWYAPVTDGTSMMIASALGSNARIPGKPDSREITAPPSETLARLSKKVKGVWRWHVVDDDGTVRNGPMGLFGFIPAKDSLKGTNLSLIGRVGSPGPKIWEMHLSEFTVNAESDAIGSFSIPTANGGRMENRFELARDGKTLRGQSLVKAVIGGHAVHFAYRWQAKRED